MINDTYLFTTASLKKSPILDIVPARGDQAMPSSTTETRNNNQSILTILPKELTIQILTHIFQPWSATVDITCELQPILHTQVLRTCTFFHTEGLRLIKKSFTGEFIRYDRRGCIIDQNLKPLGWYRWIMQHTTTLHIHDAGFTLWYIHRYWEAYPRLERFRVTVLQESTYAGNPAVEMPDYLDRRARCDMRTQHFVEGQYSFHRQLFLESSSAIYHDLKMCQREEWPLVEYRFHDCRCHPERRTVVQIKHRTTRPEVEFLIDETFVVTAYHDIQGQYRRLHTVLVDCMALPNARFGVKGLQVVSITPTTDDI